MRKAFVLAALLVLGACGHNPAAPTEPVQEPPAIRMPSVPDGAIPSGMQVCYTKPRYYCNVQMTACWLQVEFYFAPTCPAVPIK